MTPAIVYTDGSYHRDTESGGWGAVIRWRDQRWKVGGAMKSNSSAHAEFFAIVKALYAIPNGHPVCVFCDELVIVIKHRKKFAGRNAHLIWKSANCPDHRAAHRIAYSYMRELRETVI